MVDLTAAELKDLLYLTIAARPNGNGCEYGLDSVENACWREQNLAARQLPAGSVQQLLQHCINMGAHKTLSNLCWALPAAGTLSPTAVSELLQSAVESGMGDLVNAICWGLWMAANLLSSEIICSVLERVIDVKLQRPDIEVLFSLEGAQQLNRAEARKLLSKAIKADRPAFVAMALPRLPAAKQMSRQKLRGLLNRAWEVWGATASASSSSMTSKFQQLRSLAFNAFCAATTAAYKNHQVAGG